MPVIVAFRRLRQEDSEFQDSLGCIVKLCLKKITNQPATKNPNKTKQNNKNLKNKTKHPHLQSLFAKREKERQRKDNG
jgi:hypothetical protein